MRPQASHICIYEYAFGLKQLGKVIHIYMNIKQNKTCTNMATDVYAQIIEQETKQICGSRYAEQD